MSEIKLVDLVQALDLTVSAGSQELEKPVTGGYASDLLSDVIANSKEKRRCESG